jgi:hypothetical protein
MSAAEKIWALFEQNTDWSVVELSREIGVSKQLVHRIVKKLVDEGKIQKLGLPPKTIYRKPGHTAPISSANPFSETDSIYLQNNFLAISETGEYLEGYNGFGQWCIKRNLPVQKTFDEFKKTKQKYQRYYNTAGIIDGLEKIKQTKGFEDIYLDELYYLDFYAIERFGKTKLGTILHFAKQGQNKFLMNILLDKIKTSIKLRRWGLYHPLSKENCN